MVHLSMMRAAIIKFQSESSEVEIDTALDILDDLSAILDPIPSCQTVVKKQLIYRFILRYKSPVLRIKRRHVFFGPESLI